MFPLLLLSLSAGLKNSGMVFAKDVRQLLRTHDYENIIRQYSHGNIEQLSEEQKNAVALSYFRIAEAGMVFYEFGLTAFSDLISLVAADFENQSDTENYQRLQSIQKKLKARFNAFRNVTTDGLELPNSSIGATPQEKTAVNNFISAVTPDNPEQLMASWFKGLEVADCRHMDGNYKHICNLLKLGNSSDVSDIARVRSEMNSLQYPEDRESIVARDIVDLGEVIDWVDVMHAKWLGYLMISAIIYEHIDADNAIEKAFKAHVYLRTNRHLEFFDNPDFSSPTMKMLKAIIEETPCYSGLVPTPELMESHHLSLQNTLLVIPILSSCYDNNVLSGYFENTLSDVMSRLDSQPGNHQRYAWPIGWPAFRSFNLDKTHQIQILTLGHNLPVRRITGMHDMALFAYLRYFNRSDPLRGEAYRQQVRLTVIQAEKTELFQYLASLGFAVQVITMPEQTVSVDLIIN